MLLEVSRVEAIFTEFKFGIENIDIKLNVELDFRSVLRSVG